MTPAEGPKELTPAQRRGALSPAVRARTILATSRSARLVTRAQEMLGGSGGEGVPPSRAVAVVDDGGEPLLFVPPGQDPVSGVVTLHLESPELGRLVLMGRAASADGDHACEHGGASSRLAVATVGVAPGHDRSVTAPSEEARRQRARAVLRLEPVTLDAYVTAEPDLWAATGDSLLTHLTESHGPQLLQLARSRGAVTAHFAQARDIGPSGLTLAVADERGVGLMRVPFSGRALHPGQALRELAAYFHTH